MTGTSILHDLIFDYTLRNVALGSALLGTLIVLLVSLIPFVAVITGIAAVLGSGAFVYRAFKHRNDVEMPTIPGWQTA